MLLRLVYSLLSLLWLHNSACKCVCEITYLIFSVTHWEVSLTLMRDNLFLLIVWFFCGCRMEFVNTLIEPCYILCVLYFLVLFLFVEILGFFIVTIWAFFICEHSLRTGLFHISFFISLWLSYSCWYKNTSVEYIKAC